MKLDIVDVRSQKVLITLNDVKNEQTVGSIKREVYNKLLYLNPERQALRLEPKGKPLPDEETLGELNLPAVGAQLYLRDLGRQIGWETVFVLEYLGPLVVYFIFYLRPFCIYGSAGKSEPMQSVVKLAFFCWGFHYMKRILETLYVHRFSKATMPLLNLFKNCGYYWGFAAFVAYFLNHPLYTPPTLGTAQVVIGCIGFFFAELGNYSIHAALRDLRPAGTKERKIPMPNLNPFTNMFNMVSCPNYTYEALAWFSFSVMTQCAPALIFNAVGLYQMSVWAIGKHTAYKKEFPNYPKDRRAIVPYIL